MKNFFQGSAKAAIVALAAVAPLASPVHALTLTWLSGPQNGQAFTSGGIVVKALNYDTGSLYNTIPIGTSVGYSGSPGAGVAGGETTLNGITARQALNAMPSTEDSWGIIKITQIQAIASDGILRDVYNAAVSPLELTAMFWGIRDFSLTQVSAGSGLPGAGQVIDGTGMRVDIYSDASKDFNQTPGPAGRIGISSYPTVTNGTLELSLLSTPGFINANGTFGGSAAEFESNTASVGYAALNVIGGASAAQFNTNAIGFQGSSGAAFIPGVAGQASTDVWFAFTATQGTNGWDVNSNDPMLANITTPTVPDGGTTVLMLFPALALMALGYGRFRNLQA